MKPETKEEIQKLVAPEFLVADINEVNWKVDGQPGHPFTIGPKHVAYASDHRGGMLGQDVCEKIPCAAPKCHKPYSSHTHDTVAFLKLTANISEARAKEVLAATPLVDAMTRAGIDGFCFVETTEKYRISKEA